MNVHKHTYTHIQSSVATLTHERVTAEQLAEAKQLWTTHTKGVVKQPRDPNEPM